jgi:nucleoside recognition membrane protein YjiH
MTELTELMNWQFVLFLVGLIAAWSLMTIATLRWMLSRYFSQYDNQLQSQDRSTRELETDFLKFQATLPIEYVRKEDAIRQEVVINAKLDALAMKMDKMRNNHE